MDPATPESYPHGTTLSLPDGLPIDDQHRFGQWAHVAAVSPQAACALQQQVDGCKVSGDQVEIEIKALFGDLGGDEDFSSCARVCFILDGRRSEEHTSELQSLMRISYAVFCLKKKQVNI